MKVSVVYAEPDSIFRRDVQVAPGATIRQVILASGIVDACPDLDLGATHRVGIFGRLAGLETTLNEGDQVEIYRPLKRDPKEARRLRARGKFDPRRPAKD